MKVLLTRFAIFVFILIKVFCRAIPYEFRKRIGSFIGDIYYCFSIHRRAIARVNLELILGKEKRNIARKVFQHLGINLIEFLSLPYLKPEEIRKLCNINGKEHLESALREGKGAILLTAHFGNWELLGARLAVEGFRVVSLARPQGEFEKYIGSIRKISGYETISVDSGILSLVSFLKKGRIVSILSDQNILIGGVIAPFFGIPVSTPPGAAILAIRSGAPVVPAFDVRVGRFHTIHIQPPLKIIRDGNFKESVIKNTAMFNKIIEDWVRKYPEQWLWLHNRWRRI
ncbi:lysophospholipid acyltransferase family protein [bacterium]|nr:lysophospholipid acyltransferase family protein [bacterium]